MKTIIIIGSSRKNGDTRKAAEQLASLSDWAILDLNDYRFSYYDYEHSNQDDDFLELVRILTKDYDTFVFATPVYWYAMSGIMKVFFDRITDLLEIEKDLGRQLRGKYMAALSSSVGNNLGSAFWLPFSETAKYLGMRFLGGLHTIEGEKDEEKWQAFVQAVDKPT